MKQAYITRKFSRDSLDLIEKANGVIKEYDDKGYQLTLRQLYYQLVARGFIENNRNSYKRVGDLISHARLAGLIDWYSITDNTRGLYRTWHNESPREVLDSIKSKAQSYSLDKWQNQPNYVEVWVEKDAVANIVAAACKPLDVPYFACKGYCSQSEMWSAADRFIEKICVKGRYVIYLGDHDPSGIDMPRDISERLNLFGADVEIKRVALTMEQIDKLKPPPNPAKITDSRAGKYITKFGNDSWELDALSPEFITELIKTEILKLRDDSLYEQTCKQEELEKQQLQDLINTFNI